MEYTLIRSGRRTLALEISPSAELIVRAPAGCPRSEIDRFVQSRRSWIEAHTARQQQRLLAHPEPDAAAAAALRQTARAVLPARVAHYAAIMGLTPSGVAITGARTRFGSCSGKNRLCFSWRLMQYPDAAVDYVVVHELAHIVHKNHSPAFHALVASVLPDHRERRALLRE